MPFKIWEDWPSLKRVLREGEEKELDTDIFSNVSDAFSHELFKTKLDGALSNLFQGVASLLMAGVLN